VFLAQTNIAKGLSDFPEMLRKKNKDIGIPKEQQGYSVPQSHPEESYLLPLTHWELRA
jgi:hypothetical protein